MSWLDAFLQLGTQGPAGPIGSTGPTGPAGPTGPTGPVGSGITLPSPVSVSTSGNVAGSSSIIIIREDIDMSAASPITRTLPTNANFQTGSIYWVKLLNLGTTANISPVTFAVAASGVPMEDPENPGGPVSFTSVKCSMVGATLAWQKNVNTGLQLIIMSQLPGIPQ